ncbi:MAG: GNAT family N-acetyltransferase [Halobacterium sp.]
MPGPVVESGERITFRTVEREDAEFLQQSATHPRIRFPLGQFRHKNRAERRDQLGAHAEGDDSYAFLVCLDDDGAPAGHAGDATTPIGAVMVHGVDGDRAWLSYWLVPAFHGEGYGGEAAGLAVDYVFRNTGVHAVSAGAYDFNDESRGLLESLGFTEDVREREGGYADGEYRDLYVYSLLRREWEGRRGD